MNNCDIAFRTYVYGSVEIDSCGPAASLKIGACVIEHSGQKLEGTHQVQIAYSHGTLFVLFDGARILAEAINLVSALGDGSAYVGLTGGSGLNSEVTSINSWTLATGDPELSAATAAALAPTAAAKPGSPPPTSPAQPVPAAAQPASASAAPSGATLLINCKTSCDWTLDGAAQARIAAGGTQAVPVSIGQHLIVLVSPDGLDRSSETVEFTSAQQYVKTFDLGIERALREGREASAKQIAEAQKEAARPVVVDKSTGLTWAKANNRYGVSWNDA
jgi:hypothetical protein